jgi:hypothetical protein
MGRTPVWAGPTGRRLILDLNALRARTGLSKTKAIEELCTQAPWNKWDPESLRHAYNKARRHHGDSPMPIAADELTVPQSAKVSAKQPTIDAQSRNRWMSLLQKWGIPPEEARGLVTRLIAMATDAQKRSYVGQLFDYVDRRRTWNRKRKADFVRRRVDEMEANPLRWPLLQEGSDRRVKAILAVLNNGPATITEVVHATGLNAITVQNYLHCMCSDDEVMRVGFGRYALPTETLVLARHVPPAKTILNTLARGSATQAEIRARTGLSKAQVAGCLHVLKKRGKVVLTDYGKYALPGTATPHVYTKDAIDKALQSGSKTVPELMKLTGKNRGEIWAALRRKKVKGEVVQAYLVYPGRRGRLAAFVLPGPVRNRAISYQVRN